ncbi:PREDICTED: protein-cysteine N-palmitoyltransferase Rasp isoform X2 [Wasmannia auropunctata]|uniref:protein-cysteine N-palmitoyltransferase Rasp isoform X2 n=1 Tax=Wasmannia auropunctata TaxID=64793 RepID=UPI0005EF3E98|nr:PREDICTED: protein-cysteine N-palmitoyltransferase Rasp isoform X2 [Wasmannia auropunctata]
MKNNNLVIINYYESYFYFFVWSCAIFYSVYQFYLANNYFNDYYDAYGDFDSGWFWVRKKRDTSDQEWLVWLTLVNKLIPYVFIHHFISQIIKVNSNSMILCYWYILSSIIFLYYYLGTLAMFCAILQPSFLHIMTCICSKNAAWIIHILYLFIIHILKIPNGTFQSWLEITDEKHYILTLIMCWIHLRSISHTIDSIDDQFSSSNNFIQKLAYCLYLPTLFLGPLILYHEFVESINQPHQYWNCQKLLTFMLNLIRYMFWLYFTDLLLHFIYINAVQYHLQVIQNLNSWALFGLGYCMGQFFLNKYVAIYGTCSNLCYLDNIKAPSQPKCIARIHLYSDMWKYFDRGLYKFLIRYIYIPIRKSNGYFGKLFASFLCFTFVFIWHGIQINIFIWTLLNFIGIVIEDIGVSIGKSKQYHKIQNTYLSSKNTKRLNCILASPLLAMSAISNFYFLGGQDIGNIFIQNILYGSWKNLLVLLFFLYCCCQVSEDVKSWELRRTKS